jgi:Xaa-Pro aminopeptidase
MPWKPPRTAGATVFVWANYSLQERDRRWRAVRENAAAAGLDCIFVPLGNGIDARYLTQLRCSSVIMPTGGSSPIVIADRSSHNEWVPEPWQTSREWSEPMAEALLEAGMERARIGVVGLQGGKVSHVSSIDGVVNHGAFAAVQRRLPNAKFEDATDVVGFVRYLKSGEEIDSMRKATEIAEAGIDELSRAARPEIDEAVLYSRVIARMLELGAEYFPPVLTTETIDRADTKRSSNPPHRRRLKSGTIIRGEVNAVWGTQIASEHQTVLLGPIPGMWKSLIERQREVFEAGLRLMTAGAACSGVLDFARSIEHQHRIKTEILLRGAGIGDDGPIIGPKTQADSLTGLILEKNTLWHWRPAVTSADGSIQFAWGGTVLVTEKGGELLSRRDHGMISIE